MDCSPPFPSLIAAPSPDGTLLAVVTASPSPTPTSSTRRTITVRSLASLAIVAQWKDLPRVGLPPGARPAALRWAQPVLRKGVTGAGGGRDSGCHRRLLYADERGVIVLDVLNPDWRAVFGNGSGSMGKVVFADFATGSSPDWPIGPPPLAVSSSSSLPQSAYSACGTEVLVFFEFGSQLVLFFVDGPMAGRSVVVRDPKPVYPPRLGVAFRDRRAAEIEDGKTTRAGLPRTSAASASVDRVMAVLSRPGPQDVLTFHSGLLRDEYGILATAVLPTVDAQGLKWSPCGNWVAVWDSPSLGCVVHVYTAAGELYRTFDTSSDGVVPAPAPALAGGQIDPEDEAVLPKLGVRTLEWSPGSEYLAVGTYDRNVLLLSAKTFSPVVCLDHTPVIEIDPYPVWTEHSSAPGTYSEAAQPVTVPAAPGSGTGLDGLPKTGTSHLAFSAHGRVLATVSDGHPTAVWIWDIRQLVVRAVIVQRAPVRAVRWHPTIEGVLMICCAPVAREDSVVYLWEAGWLAHEKGGERAAGDNEQDGPVDVNGDGCERGEGVRSEGPVAGDDDREEIPADSPPVLVELSREFRFGRPGKGEDGAAGGGGGGGGGGAHHTSPSTPAQRLDVQWLNTDPDRQVGVLVSTSPIGIGADVAALCGAAGGPTSGSSSGTTTSHKGPGHGVVGGGGGAGAGSTSVSSLPSVGRAIVVWPGGRDKIFRLDHDEKMLYGGNVPAAAAKGGKRGRGEGRQRSGDRKHGLLAPAGGHPDGEGDGDADDSVFDILTKRLDGVGIAENGDRDQECGDGDGDGGGGGGDAGSGSDDDSAGGEQVEYTEYEYDDEVDGDGDGDGEDEQMEYDDDDDDGDGDEDGDGTLGTSSGGRTVSAHGGAGRSRGRYAAAFFGHDSVEHDDCADRSDGDGDGDRDADGDEGDRTAAGSEMWTARARERDNPFSTMRIRAGPVDGSVGDGGAEIGNRLVGVRPESGLGSGLGSRSGAKSTFTGVGTGTGTGRGKRVSAVERFEARIRGAGPR